jgi:S1-C subfamily serine protease
VGNAQELAAALPLVTESYKRISSALQAGNSGGPLLNMKGEVVGIAVGKLNALMVFEWTGDLPENAGYAIKVAYLRALLDSAPRSKSRLRELAPVEGASLEKLAECIRPSVLLVVAE